MACAHPLQAVSPGTVYQADGKRCFQGVLFDLLLPVSSSYTPSPIAECHRGSQITSLSVILINLCRFLPTAELSSACLQTDSLVADSNISFEYYSQDQGSSFPNSFLSTFLREVPRFLFSSLLRKISLSSTSFLKESPVALGLFQTTPRNQKIK